MLENMRTISLSLCLHSQSCQKVELSHLSELPEYTHLAPFTNMPHMPLPQQNILAHNSSPLSNIPEYASDP